jgi:nitrous oxidase accessory protein NosD
LILFRFCLGLTVVHSSIGASKGSGGEDVRLQEPLIVVEGIVVHESGMIDVALTSRHEGVIDRDIVCSLLTECLQDVRFAVVVMLCLFTFLLGFNLYLLLY